MPMRCRLNSFTPLTAARRGDKTLFTYLVDPGARKLVARLHEVDAEREQIARRGAVTFVMQERTDTQPVPMCCIAANTIRCATKYIRACRRFCRRWRNRCRAIASV